MAHSKSDLTDTAFGGGAGLLTGVAMWLDAHPIAQAMLTAVAMAAVSTAASWLMKKGLNYIDRKVFKSTDTKEN